MKPDLWIPLDLSRAEIGSFDLSDRSMRALHVLAKLKGGVSSSRALADVTTIGTQLSREYPSSNSGWNITLTSLREQTVRRGRAALWLLMAGVSCVLLMGCANAANLLLARGAAREEEVALRLALGGSRRAIAVSLLLEGVVYALCAAGVGLILTHWVLGWLVQMAPPHIPGLRAATLDGTVLLFAVAAAGFATFASALPLVREFPILAPLRSEGGQRAYVVRAGVSRTSW